MAPTTRSQAATQSQPSQPPKESAYNQSTNPVSHNPTENASAEQRSHTYGTAPSTITRGASSQPSNESTLSAIDQKHASSQRAMQKEGDVDTEYGVEEQPSEGRIAHAVEDQSRHRVQAGAHAGAVGSPQGPGAPAKGEGESNLANLEEKTQLHEQILGDRVGRSPPAPDGVSVENEKVREQKLEQDRELHPKDVVERATGEPVVGR
ncbi:hypothetical protein BDV19DRAFT_384759 [Aspergillus venezuelensis]